MDLCISSVGCGNTGTGTRFNLSSFCFLRLVGFSAAVFERLSVISVSLAELFFLGRFPTDGFISTSIF